MKNILIITLCLVHLNVFAQQSPWGTYVAPNATKFKIFEGIAQVGGASLSVGDYVAAINEHEKLIGFTQIEEVVAGQSLFSLEIFESTSTANGISAGENYQLQYYLVAEEQFYTVEAFGPWTAAIKNGELADGDNRTFYNTDDTPDGSVVLPIELISFHGKSSPAGNALFWSTATEKENAHFILEKSVNGVDFVALAQVKGAGSVNHTNHYQYLDEAPFVNQTYYRLQSVDYSGRREASKVVVIESATNESTVMTLFPNPARDFINIQINAAEQINQLKIVDLTGKVIIQQSITKTVEPLQIDVQNWVAGMYIVQLRGATEQWTELLTVK